MSNYHYTKGCHLPSIVKDGMIRTTHEGCEEKEKPAAWLTKSPEWESECNVGKTVCQRVLVDGQIYGSYETKIVTESNDYMRKEVGMCRILISEKLPTITWAKFKHVSGITERTYNSLDRTCRRNGSPVDKWLCTFKVIPEKYWEGIEMFVDDQWVRWDEKIPIQEFVNLCLSSNGKQDIEKTKINGFTIKHIKIQLDFINTHYHDIVKVWEANKNKKGYIEVNTQPDYTLNKNNFRFIESQVQESSFKPLWKSETNTYALVHFIWEASSTHCRIALAYDKSVSVNSEKSIYN